MVIVHQSGRESSRIVPAHADTIGQITEVLMRSGAFREVRFEPAGPNDGPLWPPDSWTVDEQLEFDNELPPLDRPKIQ